MPEKTPCPSCGAPARGNFCSSCGAALGGRHCTQCGVALVPGARFCNDCGAPAGATAAPTSSGGDEATPASRSGKGRSSSGGAGAASRGKSATEEAQTSSTLGWWVAGAMMVLVITILALPILRPDESAPPASAGGGTGAMPPATTDISNMTPMEAANALYDRVMRAASANDSAQVQMFLPMAIDAHEMARPLTADAAFHLSSLQRMALQNADALATARTALEEDPDHLLLLYTGGEAARALGQDEVAREFAVRMLEAWDREIGSTKSEYELHSSMMPDVRAFAEENGGGE